MDPTIDIRSTDSWAARMRFLSFLFLKKKQSVLLYESDSVVDPVRSAPGPLSSFLPKERLWR